MVRTTFINYLTLVLLVGPSYLKARRGACCLVAKRHVRSLQRFFRRISFFRYLILIFAVKWFLSKTKSCNTRFLPKEIWLYVWNENVEETHWKTRNRSFYCLLKLFAAPPGTSFKKSEPHELRCCMRPYQLILHFKLKAQRNQSESSVDFRCLHKLVIYFVLRIQHRSELDILKKHIYILPFFFGVNIFENRKVLYKKSDQLWWDWKAEC